MQNKLSATSSKDLESEPRSPLKEENKYWAFISYSSKDKKWGTWLHKKLENYPIPQEFRDEKIFDGAVLGKNLRPIFRDRDELSGSSELGPAILKALKNSRFLVVLCSKNSAQSKWVNKELEDFRELEEGNDKRILALILDGEPNASTNNDFKSTEECLPPALRYPLEPLAGDLRKEGDGKERGFLKILAGISQIKFDKLYRRHERTQQKKRLILGASALAIISLLSLLTIFALNQKELAEEKEQQALLSSKKAKKAQKQTTIILRVALDLYEEPADSELKKQDRSELYVAIDEFAKNPEFNERLRPRLEKAMRKAIGVKHYVQLQDIQHAISAFYDDYNYLPYATKQYPNEDALMQVSEDFIKILDGTNKELNPNGRQFLRSSNSSITDQWGQP